MRFIVVIILSTSLLLSGCSSARLNTKSDIRLQTPLPKSVNETSGLIYFNNYFWTHNDSGGKPELYAINPKNGKIVKTISIKSAKNIDWEDITQDDNYIYIADTGNNSGQRRAFQIYKVAKKDILTSKKVKPELITFSFKHQPTNLKLYRHNYDMEALCIIDGQLMTFSKNWDNNKTSLYHIKNGTADLVKTYNPKALITGAVYDKKSNAVYLIGYHKYAKINNRAPFIYTIKNFSTAKEITQNYPLKAVRGFQTEAIEIVDNQLFFTNEKNKKGKQALWVITKL